MTEPKIINYIDIEIMEKMCHPIAVALFDSKSDPIPKFSDYEREKLESALGNPRQTFGGKELYPTFTQKAAILYYGLNKNHPFKNGNKRTATATLLVFLYINNFWIDGIKKYIEDYLVNLAQRVARSEGVKEKDKFLAEIEHWLIHNIKPQKNF